MVKLTVILVRDGETTGEVRARQDPDAVEEELDEDTVNDDLKEYIANKGTLSERVDPPLTEESYWLARDTLTHLMKALVADQEERKIAFFSAPNKSCAATAMMMTCADISKYDNLTWRLTTFDAASAPAAIPCIVSNGLCNGDAQVERMAGWRATVEGGLMHCAAMPFNDGRTKCPLGKVIKAIKDVTHDPIDEWDEQVDANGKRIHHVNYFQFMRLASANDPWSLVEMIPKVNIVVAVEEPKKYMMPPRKGWFDPKKNYTEWNDGVEPSLRQTVWWARQAGCDTVIMIVPGSAIECVANISGYTNSTTEDLETPPCCVACLVVNVEDAATSSDAMQFTMHDFTTDMHAISIPIFAGPIDELVHPQEGKDPADAPDNKWAAFPEPEPEVLRKDYPTMPPFGMSLDEPIPNIVKKTLVTPNQKKKEPVSPPTKTKKPEEPASAPKKKEKKKSTNSPSSSKPTTTTRAKSKPKQET